VAFAVHAVRVAQRTDAFLAAMPAGATRSYPPGNVRDVAMADTVEWVLEREGRVVVAAANGHVQKTPFHAPPVVPQPMTTMGRELADRLGNDLVVLGTTYSGGTAWLHRPGPDDPPGHSTPFIEDLGEPDPDSLDAALAAAGPGACFVDLRSAAGSAAAALDRTRGTYNGPELQLVDARRAFDAIIHLGRITPGAPGSRRRHVEAVGLTDASRAGPIRWSTDAHETLNVPYDSSGVHPGFADVRVGRADL
jgi:erythromycin esterase